MCSLKGIGCLACEYCSEEDRMCISDPHNPKPLPKVKRAKKKN